MLSRQRHYPPLASAPVPPPAPVFHRGVLPVPPVFQPKYRLCNGQSGSTAVQPCLRQHANIPTLYIGWAELYIEWASRVEIAQHAIQLLHRDIHHNDHSTSGGISISVGISTRISIRVSIDNPPQNFQTQITQE